MTIPGILRTASLRGIHAMEARTLSTPAEMRELLYDVARRASEYRNGLAHRSIWPSEDALARLAAFDEALPHESTDAADVVAMLDDLARDATVASAGPRYLGFVIGGTFPAALAANWLATAWDQCAGYAAMSPAAAAVEAVAARWMGEVLGLPRGLGVGFVTGSTMANTTAMLCARRAVCLRSGWDVERSGLAGAPKLTVVASADAHTSLVQGLGMIGIGTDNIVRVPVDSEGRIRVDDIPQLDGSTILCVQVGNVNSGAFDDIAACADLAEATGAWLHVDGAFGIWARVCESTAHLVHGLERADSWVTSAHKLLNVPYDSAVVMCRDAAVMEGALSTTSSYAVKGAEREPNHFTPEGSRRARGIDIWATFKQLGTVGIAQHVENCCANARRFADVLRDGGVTVLNEIWFNQVLFDLGAAQTRDRILASVAADGTTWVGPTTWLGTSAARASFCSWSTTVEDSERSAQSVIAAVRQV